MWEMLPREPGSQGAGKASAEGAGMAVKLPSLEVQGKMSCRGPMNYTYHQKDLELEDITVELGILSPSPLFLRRNT